MSESRTRDGMDPFTRAVSDALDGYLCRMGWNVSHTNPTWLAEELAEVGVELVWKRDREQEWANGYGQGRDDEANGLPLRMTAAPTGPEPRTDAAVGEVSVRQVNQMRVNGSVVSPCRHCGEDMNPKHAWWWTWHGPTCSEACASQLIELQHGGQACTEDCR